MVVDDRSVSGRIIFLLKSPVLHKHKAECVLICSAMSISPFLEGVAFEPEDVQAMSIAFDDVCQALNLPNNAKGARQVIATRIMELAGRGERDPNRLRDRVLREANGAR